MSKKARAEIADLLAAMAALRTPGSGCPWDLEQTLATIAPYTIEEAYEVADAIEKRDLVALKEELGDLLLQVVYHARMAEEQGAFAFGDVVDAITTKMIRRHPHVFGTPEQRAAGAAPGFWERIKAEEKEQARTGIPFHIVPEARLRHDVGEGQGGGDGRSAKVGSPPTPSPSPQGGRELARILDDVPAALPALTRAVKLQHKAARVGFDWPSLAPVFDKLKEELGELEQAVASPGGDEACASINEEFGDLLFVVANVARHLGLDPEAALRGANQKFIRRFARIEDALAAQGRTPAQSNLAEMDRLWDEAKADEQVPSPRSSRGEG